MVFLDVVYSFLFDLSVLKEFVWYWVVVVESYMIIFNMVYNDKLYFNIFICIKNI